MMGTWGVVKQAHDIMKQNRALLGKKKTARELYREEIQNHPTTMEGVTVEGLRERVRERIKRERKHAFASKLGALFFIALLVAALAWMAMMIFDPPKRAHKEGQVTSKYFSSK